MHSYALGILNPKNVLRQKLLVKQHISPEGHASLGILLTG
jgi:hypothetical protein